MADLLFRLPRARVGRRLRSGSVVQLFEIAFRLAHELGLILNATALDHAEVPVPLFDRGFPVPDFLPEERGEIVAGDVVAVVELDRPSVGEDCLTRPAKRVESSGETKLMQFFLGQVMKASRGKADPRLAQRVLEERLPA